MRSTRWIVSGVGLTALIGCSPTKSQSPDIDTRSSALTGGCISGQPCTLTIPVPQGLTPEDVVLTGTSSLAIGNGVAVENDIGTFGTVANLGSGGTNVGVSSQIGVVKVGNVVSEGSVFLANHAVVNGSVQTGGTLTEQQGAIITGTVTKQPVLTDASRQVTITFPTNAPAVTLQPGASQTLAPGAYGSVTVNSRATLSLSAGTYLFASLDTEPQATLNLNESAGPIIIYLENTLLYKGVEIQTGSDGNLFIGIFGTQGISLQSPFRGTIVAPNAPLELTTQTAGFAGAFWGSRLQVDPNSPITGLGAVIPSSAQIGVSPTLNCVVQLSSTQIGAVFGYTNTTGANVTLGAGPHNFLSPGFADDGQPILFLPGRVPIATFQTFPVGGHLSYTIGQQVALATQSSPVCPAALATSVKQLFVATPAATAVRTSVAALLGNPRFVNLITSFQTAAGSQLTPFEASLFQVLQVIMANADLLGDPTTLTASQLARIPAFRATVLGNAAVTQLRLTGDALKGSASGVACNVVAAINTDQPLEPIFPPQAGSVFAQTLAISQSVNAVAARNNVVSIATNSTSAPTLLATPGLLLAGLLPAAQLEALQLGGPIPTGWLSTLAGAVTGAVIGATVGVIVGTVAGDGPGAIIGGIIGGVIGGIAGAENPVDFGASCQNCTADDQCGDDDCVDGCCAGSQVFVWTVSFLSGTACTGTAQACTTDDNCASGLKCIQDCCINPQTFPQLCSGNTCTVDSDCHPGNVCNTGCCLGPCGVNGFSCDVVTEPPMCGGPDGGSSQCAVGTCNNGCCGIIVP